MNKIIKILPLIFSVAACCCSCKKFVQIAPPKNQLDNTAVFSDSANANAAMVGLYVSMMQNFALNLTSGGLSLYTGMSADELYPTTNNITEEDFYNNTLIANNSLNNMHFWTHGYKLIYQANACLEGIANATNISQSLKNQLTGEARFVRAFIYFNLTNLYGPVPLPLTVDYSTNRLLARSSSEDIYSQIIKDLKTAQQDLTVNDPSGRRFRPNRHTATALLAKVLLYQKKWPEAEIEATTIINSGLYSLEADLNNVFMANSNESIWRLSPVFDSKETWEGYFFIPTSTTSLPKYVITPSLLNAFELEDKRKTSWLKKNTINGSPYYYPFKYKLRSASSTPLESNTVFRLAEQYLVRAEARAMQNNFQGAIADLNILRSRAGLPDLSSGLNQQQVIAAIFQEKRIELFCEWGNRWFDLKRSEQAGTVLQPLKSNWQETDTLYPVPESELETNPNLQQNDGY